MAKDINIAFAQIEKQSKQMAIDAMRRVAQKAYAIAKKTAQNCLARYYENYRPQRYKRTKQLRRAIRSPKPQETKKGNTYILSFYIQYNSKYLDGLYHSNSWYHQSGSEWKSVVNDRNSTLGQDNGIPESGWILSNYLQGIHPWAQTDTESTDTVMTRFFEKDLPSMAGDMIYQEMQDAIIGFLKTYGGG